MTAKYRNLSVALVAVFMFVFLASGVALAAHDCDMSGCSAACKTTCKGDADCQKKCQDICKEACKDHKPGEHNAACKAKCEELCKSAGMETCSPSDCANKCTGTASATQANATLANATKASGSSCCANSKTAEVKQASAKSETDCAKSCGSAATKACTTTKSCSMASKGGSQ